MAILTRSTTESTSRTQTETFTIPGLTKLNGVTVNTGNIEIVDVDGDKVTISVFGGSYTRRVQTGGSPSDSKHVTGQTSANYNSGGYSGTLTRYVYSGSYTPADSKSVNPEYSGSLSAYNQAIGEGATTQQALTAAGLPIAKNYNSGGYTGQITRQSGTARFSGSTVYVSYSGTVTRPESDTRVYRYQGTVTKPDTRTYQNYYQYDVTFNYGTNSAPTITLNTLNDQTFYENDVLKIDGSAKDTDINDVVNVYYRINGGTSRAIATGISTGAEIPFNEQLTFKGGILYKDDTAITTALAEGVAHKLEVWAQDNQGGKSDVIERTFYVVPNRPPSLTIDPFNSLSDLINADKITLTGSTFDPDGNDMVVSYKLNGGLNTEVYRGKDGDWSFDLLLKYLKDGENTIVIETVDSYHFKTSLTRKINKTANSTPLTQSVQRYTIVPPAGSAQGVLLWIERDENQEVQVEISMTNENEQEVFKSMELDSSGPLNMGTTEDFFKFRADEPAENIAIKITWTGDKPIYSVSGALTQ